MNPEARAALAAFPGGMHIGGGVNASNARGWLEAGASHVIVTSWVFREGRVDWARLDELVKAIGKERLVLDLSCRKRGEAYFVVTDRWQKFTDLEVNAETLQNFSAYCVEFLIHAVDVEGLCRGIDRYELVEKLGRWTPIPMTYAGGANSLTDLEEVTRRWGRGSVDRLDDWLGTGHLWRQRREIRGLRGVQSPALPIKKPPPEINSSGDRLGDYDDYFTSSDFGGFQHFLAILFRDCAGDGDFFAGVLTNFLVEFLHIFAGQVIGDFLAVHRGDEDGFAFVGRVQRALGATGVAGDGDFLVIGGKSRGGEAGDGISRPA